MIDHTLIITIIVNTFNEDVLFDVRIYASWGFAHSDENKFKVQMFFFDCVRCMCNIFEDHDLFLCK